MANVTTTAETNLIKAAQMRKVREVDFVEQFGGNILPKLMEALGVTRKIPMQEGTTMYVYKTTGQLANNGVVPEGEIIPLSQYERTKDAVGEITLKKWRKASSAESIKKSGYQEAVTETDRKLLNDVQKGIRTDFFTFLSGIVQPAQGTEGQSGYVPPVGVTVTGSTLQEVLAQSWGQLQVLFEDDAIQAVHFINPLTIADYLGTAQVTIQTAFGMNYIEDFLGLGTVVMNSNITKDVVYSTAQDNLILYYLTMNGDVANAFELTADETGYIGIKSGYQNEQRAQIESLIMSGIQLLVEYADGVVKGTVSQAGYEDEICTFIKPDINRKDSFSDKPLYILDDKNISDNMYAVTPNVTEALNRVTRKSIGVMNDNGELLVQLINSDVIKINDRYIAVKPVED